MRQPQYTVLSEGVAKAAAPKSGRRGTDGHRAKVDDQAFRPDGGEFERVPLSPLDRAGAGWPVKVSGTYSVPIPGDLLPPALEQLAQRAPLLAGRFDRGSLSFVLNNRGIPWRLLSTDVTRAEWDGDACGYLTALPTLPRGGGSGGGKGAPWRNKWRRGKGASYVLANPPRDPEAWPELTPSGGDDDDDDAPPLLAVNLLSFADNTGSLLVATADHAVVDGAAMSRIMVAIVTLLDGRELLDPLRTSRSWLPPPAVVARTLPELRRVVIAEVEPAAAKVAAQGKPKADANMMTSQKAALAHGRPWWLDDALARRFLRTMTGMMLPGGKLIPFAAKVRGVATAAVLLRTPSVKRVLRVPQAAIDALHAEVMSLPMLSPAPAAAGGEGGDEDPKSSPGRLSPQLLLPLLPLLGPGQAPGADGDEAARVLAEDLLRRVSKVDVLTALLWLLAVRGKDKSLKVMWQAIRVTPPELHPHDEPVANSALATPAILQPLRARSAACLSRRNLRGLCKRLSAGAGPDASAARQELLEVLRAAAVAVRASIVQWRACRPLGLRAAAAMCATQDVPDPMGLAVTIDLIQRKADVVTSWVGGAAFEAAASFRGAAPASVGVQGGALMPYTWHGLRRGGSQGGAEIHMPMTARGAERALSSGLIEAFLPAAQVL